MQAIRAISIIVTIELYVFMFISPSNLVDMVSTGTFPQNGSLPLPDNQDMLSKKIARWPG